MAAESWFIERCLTLSLGDIEHYPAMGYFVYKIKEGWWALWMNPMPKLPLGKELITPLELRAFLAGNVNVGRSITAETDIIPGLNS